MKSFGPKDVKINYKITKACGGSFGSVMLNLLSKRLRVKQPMLRRYERSRSGFSYPNLILLSAGLYDESMKKFVASCVHEFAHYMHARKMSKVAYGKLSNKEKHNQDFFEWLVVVSKAAWARDDGAKYYPWDLEYKSVFNKAVRAGIIKHVKA